MKHLHKKSRCNSTECLRANHSWGQQVVKIGHVAHNVEKFQLLPSIAQVLLVHVHNPILHYLLTTPIPCFSQQFFWSSTSSRQYLNRLASPVSRKLFHLSSASSSLSISSKSLKHQVKYLIEEYFKKRLEVGDWPFPI